MIINSGIKAKIAVLNLLQYAALGAWLVTISSYVKFGKSTLSTLENGDMYASAIVALPVLASLIMPLLIGMLSDKLIQAQSIMGMCHILAASFIAAASFTVSFPLFYCLMALAMMFYMPTIALNNSVAYNALYAEELVPMKYYPRLRVWGYVGFLSALWTVDLLGAERNNMQLWISAGISVVTALVAFAMPACHIRPVQGEQSFVQKTGLDIFEVFKRRKMAVFFIFAMLLGIVLKINQVYALSSAGLHGDPTMLVSVVLISTIIFIPLLPYILRQFGIRSVIVASFVLGGLSICILGIFSLEPSSLAFYLPLVMCGIAAEVFGVAGSLYADQSAPMDLPSSTQGLFMTMTSLGIVIGLCLGKVLEGTGSHWQEKWYIFAICAFICAALYMVLHKWARRK